jgi:hypothetical protein
MFLRKLDLLSPPITLYYKKETSHSSIVSGILSIIAYSICFAFIVMNFLQYIHNTNPNVYYYNRFVEEAGEFPVNASSMFNFIQIKDTRKNIPDIIDFDIFNIIGIEKEIDIYEQDPNLANYNHWLYGPCNNTTDTEGIRELITFDHFTESGCIRKYYNKDDKVYYDTNSPNFIWPRILHGCGHPNRTFYGIIVEKCRNTTLKLLGNGNHCKTEKEIQDYINRVSINLKIIDQYTDMFNYTTPYRKYFYSISNGIFSGTYTTNHLNFNPSTLISDEGIVFEDKKETLSYLFDQNEKITTSSKSGICAAYYFWMQRRMQYYERIYKKFQDILSDVGGLSSFIISITYLLILLINNYISLFDIKDYMNEISEIKEYNNIFKININNLSEIDANNKLFPPKLNNKKKSRNKEGVDLIKSKGKFEDKNKLKINNSSLTRNHLLINTNNLFLNNDNLIRKTGCLSYNDKNIMKEKMDSKSSLNMTAIATYNKNNITNKGKKAIEKKDKENVNIEKIKNKQLNFINYLYYLITLHKNDNSFFQLYSDFRYKMISEENLILSNLNIDKLIQNNKRENSNNNDQQLDLTKRLNFNN